MLTRVYIDNYRCFTNFEWHPGKITLLAGRNGTGKSALIDAIRRVIARVTGVEFLERLFDRASLTRWQSRRRQIFELDVSVGRRSWTYRLVIEHPENADGEATVVEEKLTAASAVVLHVYEGRLSVANARGELEGTVPVGDTAISYLSFASHPEIESFREAVRACWCVAPMPRPRHDDLSRPARLPSYTLSNFIAWYRSLSGDYQVLERLTAQLRETIPGFRALKLDPSLRGSGALTVIMGPPESKRGTPEPAFLFSELSDGEQMLIMLYTLAEAAPLDTGTLILDEPDNFLGLVEIQPWLRTLEDRVDPSEGQIILASHNTEILNRLWPDHGYLLSREPFGPVRIERASEVTDLTPPSSSRAAGSRNGRREGLALHRRARGGPVRRPLRRVVPATARRVQSRDSHARVPRGARVGQAVGDRAVPRGGARAPRPCGAHLEGPGGLHRRRRAHGGRSPGAAREGARGAPRRRRPRAPPPAHAGGAHPAAGAEVGDPELLT